MGALVGGFPAAADGIVVDADRANLLGDEPLGSLDPIARAELQSQLVAIIGALEKTVVVVTHDVREAFVFGASITLLSRGRVVQQGTFLDQAQRPAEPFVAEFLRAQAPPLACNSNSMPRQPSAVLSQKV